VLKNVGFNTYSKLYHAGVVPIVDYCAGIWGYRNFPMCDKIQNRALRYYFGVPITTPILAMQGDSGWMCPKFRRYVCLFRFWDRMVKMPVERLTRQVFDYDHRHSLGNWCSDMKMLFQRLDLEHVYDNKQLVPHDLAMSRLESIMTREWNEHVQVKPKLRTYVKFKQEFIVEAYVNDISLNRSERSLLAQFRFGILPLHIETGRYKHLTPEQRICELCNRDVEDELHFLLRCPVYFRERALMLEHARRVCETFDTLDDGEQLILLLQRCHRPVVNFLCSAWKVRKDILYA
jgi:hypothetical protein